MRLQAGRWKFESAGIKDSIITMYAGEQTINIQHDTEFVLANAKVVWTEFTKRGTENSITVNVKKVT